MKNLSLLFIAFLSLQLTSLAQEGWFELTSGTTETQDLVSNLFTDLLDAEGPAYAMDETFDGFFRFNLSDPANAVIIDTFYNNMGGADFGPGGMIYTIDRGSRRLLLVDSSNGNSTIIGSSIPVSGEVWTGIAYDQTTDTLYASSSDVGVAQQSTLYTIDPNTGTATVVGTMAPAIRIAGIDFDANGILFAYCTNTNSIYYVNKYDGSATLLGSTGVIGLATAYFGDLSFNGETGELYIIAANSSGSFELYIINLADGSATYIGPSSYTPSAFAIAGDYIIPVELTSFTADVINSIIELRWKTATEINNSGFQVEKRTENSDWNNIAFVPGFGTSTEIHSYSYSDQSVVSGNYSYRLKQIDYDGSFEYSKIVEVEVESPTRFSLSQNYPNPFNPVAAIKYQIPELSFVTIKVYDVLGGEVAILVNEEKPAGNYEIEFDATQLPSGNYFYRLQAGTFVETKKMVLMK